MSTERPEAADQASSDDGTEQAAATNVSEAAEARDPLDSVVNGTVARFEMAYSPREGERAVFGPPLGQRVPSLVFLIFALTLCGLVLIAYTGSSNTQLYVWIVEGDRGRVIGAAPLAGIVFLSAIGTVLRAQMRGVIVHSDRLEARYLLPMGVPKIRRWAWAQIERIIRDDEQLMLEMWDGTYEHLPAVADPKRLGDVLESVATNRKIRVTHMVANVGDRGARDERS